MFSPAFAFALVIFFGVKDRGCSFSYFFVGVVSVDEGCMHFEDLSETF